MQSEIGFPKVEVQFAGVSRDDKASAVFFNVLLAEIEKLKRGKKADRYIPETSMEKASEILKHAVEQCEVCPIPASVCTKIQSVDLSSPSPLYYANLTVMGHRVVRQRTIEQQLNGALCRITKKTLSRKYPVKA